MQFSIIIFSAVFAHCTKLFFFTSIFAALPLDVLRLYPPFKQSRIRKVTIAIASVIKETGTVSATETEAVSETGEIGAVSETGEIGVASETGEIAVDLETGGIAVVSGTEGTETVSGTGEVEISAIKGVDLNGHSGRTAERAVRIGIREGSEIRSEGAAAAASGVVEVAEEKEAALEAEVVEEEEDSGAVSKIETVLEAVTALLKARRSPLIIK